MTDWTTEAVDTIEKVVDAVRERTVVPAHRATKMIVFGVLAACCIVPALVLLVLGAFRGARRGVGSLVGAGGNLPARRALLLAETQPQEHTVSQDDTSEDDSSVRDVVIVGSGPAGLTAAVYTARANLHPVIIEGIGAGGQLMLTTDVENYPGFPEGILGPELMMLFREQAGRFGAEFVTADADSVDLSQHPFRVNVGGVEHLARTVIVSTGATARMLGLESEQRLLGHGVSTCATCDGFFFRDLPIAVIGGGDSALEEANFLTRFATKVTLIHRRKELRASKIMQDRVFANPKIDIMWNTVVDDVIGDGKLEALRLRDVETDGVSDLPVSGMFVAIGHTPNTSLFTGQLDLDAEGYVITKADSTKTSVPGVFAAGDVQDHVYRQAITAAGSGCMAALEAERYLETL
jgi:thioredoxin reductase (NADPH)